MPFQAIYFMSVSSGWGLEVRFRGSAMVAQVVKLLIMNVVSVVIGTEGGGRVLDLGKYR